MHAIFKSLWARMRTPSFWVMNLGMAVVFLPDLAPIMGWNLDEVAAWVRLLGALKIMLGGYAQMGFKGLVDAAIGDESVPPAAPPSPVAPASIAPPPAPAPPPAATTPEAP